MPLAYHVRLPRNAVSAEITDKFCKVFSSYLNYDDRWRMLLNLVKIDKGTQESLKLHHAFRTISHYRTTSSPDLVTVSFVVPNETLENQMMIGIIEVLIRKLLNNQGEWNTILRCAGYNPSTKKVQYSSHFYSGAATATSKELSLPPNAETLLDMLEKRVQLQLKLLNKK